jgi:microcompartment protein CcmK/EutM
MTFGIVTGTVVGTNRSDGIEGATFLLVQGCDRRLERKDEYVVALDLVGAGNGEMVLISQGSSARQTQKTFEKPIDAVVIGIVDTVSRRGTIVFRK